MTTVVVDKVTWEAAQEVILAAQGVLDSSIGEPPMLILARAVGRWEGVYNA